MEKNFSFSNDPNDAFDRIPADDEITSIIFYILVIIIFIITHNDADADDDVNLFDNELSDIGNIY